MGKLQKMFDKEIKKIFSFPVAGAKLIKKQLEKKGVSLSQDQLDNLEKKLQDINGDTLSIDFDFDEAQIKLLENLGERKVGIDFSDKELDEYYQESVRKINDSIPELIQEMSDHLLSGLKEDAHEMLKERQKEIKEFENRLGKDWKRPFDLFEMFLVIALEVGEEVNYKFRKNKANKKNYYVLEALTRLHARACQIASEILVLLKSGYADGAHARWRSLHEIAVVASFIKKHGNETAERYLLHDHIESLKASNLYKKYYQALGYEPISQEEYDALNEVCEKLIARFGNSYKNNYGWASAALNKDNPNFSHIEEVSELDHLRPYYKLASHNVHANPKGIMFKLGLLESTQNILLTGPSNVGFTDAAQGAAISLSNITIALLTINPTIDNIVASNILRKLVSEIAEGFLEVQKEIEKRDSAQQKPRRVNKKK